MWKRTHVRHTHTQTFAVCATVLLCQKSRWYVSVSVCVCVRARGCVTATGSGYISTLSSPPQRRHRSRVTFCVRFVLKTVCLRACTIARQDANVWSSLLSRWPLRHLRVHLWPDTLANFKTWGLYERAVADVTCIFFSSTEFSAGHFPWLFLDWRSWVFFSK